MSRIRPFPLDELPRHSPWPARLLAAEPAAVRPKTPEEVTREFDRDKWGSLLKAAAGNEKFRLAHADRLDVNFRACVPFFEKGRFRSVSEEHVFDRHLAYYRRQLLKQLGPRSALVELGAGYGSKILNLARSKQFALRSLHAAEYTESGRQLTALLAKREGIPLETGACDFREGRVEGISPPPGAVVFTSYAAHYIPEMPTSFVDSIRSFRPAKVVHFEPFFEFFDESSVHGLLCRGYMRVNDYTRNLLAVLREGEARKACKIVSVEKNVMGNPLMPLSCVVWKPL